MELNVVPKRQPPQSVMPFSCAPSPLAEYREGLRNAIETLTKTVRIYYIIIINKDTVHLSGSDDTRKKKR